MRLALLLIVALPTLARAQAMANDQEAAKAHFMAASAYYEQGNYRDAVREFSEAHRLSARPDLLYNIGLCYEKIGDWDRAVETLRRYLVDRPDAQDRAQIQARIGELERRRDEERPSAEVAVRPIAATPKPAALPPAKPRHVISLVVGGVGLALLASSIGTGVAALEIDQELRARCDDGVCAPSDRDEASRGRALAIATDVLIGVGAAAVVVGVVLFVLEHKRAPKSAARLDGTVVRF